MKYQLYKLNKDEAKDLSAKTHDDIQKGDYIEVTDDLKYVLHPDNSRYGYHLNIIKPLDTKSIIDANYDVKAKDILLNDQIKDLFKALTKLSVIHKAKELGIEVPFKNKSVYSGEDKLNTSFDEIGKAIIYGDDNTINFGSEIDEYNFDNVRTNLAYVTSNNIEPFTEVLGLDKIVEKYAKFNKSLNEGLKDLKKAIKKDKIEVVVDRDDHDEYDMEEDPFEEELSDYDENIENDEPEEDEELQEEVESEGMCSSADYGTDELEEDEDYDDYGM